MPSVPPFSRQERIEDYARACAPVVWRQEMIESGDGVKIALAVGNIHPTTTVAPGIRGASSVQHVVVLYFQGNGSSLPPRLQALSNVLKTAATAPGKAIAITLVALSYRGFWTSSGRASQPGIEKDAKAAIAWARGLQASLGHDTSLFLWGQSLGAGVATQSLSKLLEEEATYQSPNGRVRHIDGLILETPFTSVRAALTSLYPQKWLPYRYLWPFLRSWWDSEAALRIVGEHHHRLRLLILSAENDEVVPTEHGELLVELSQQLGFEVQYEMVRGALHHEVCLKGQGRMAIARFLQASSPDMLHGVPVKAGSPRYNE